MFSLNSPQHRWDPSSLKQRKIISSSQTKALHFPPPRLWKVKLTSFYIHSWPYFFFFYWNSHLYVSVHPQLVIEVFYGFLTYLQEIGLKGKKGKLNNYSSHFWLCALPLTALSGIYEYCIPVLYHIARAALWVACSKSRCKHEILSINCRSVQHSTRCWNILR